MKTQQIYSLICFYLFLFSPNQDLFGQKIHSDKHNDSTGYFPAYFGNNSPEIKTDTSSHSTFYIFHDTFFIAYVQSQLKISESCEELNINTTVRIHFMIDTFGNVKNAKLLDKISNCKDLEIEILRVFAGAPPWKPAIADGKKINTWRIIPLLIQFE